MVMNCPICGNRKIGLIGVHRYFCSECCHEFVLSTKKREAYYPGVNGEIRAAGSVGDVARRYIGALQT